MGKTKRMTKVQAGRVVWLCVYDQAQSGDEPRARAAKSRLSSEARQRLNMKASWQKLEQVLAANFDRHDLFITLTYRDAPPTREWALRQVNSFLRQLRASRSARGEELRYVKCTEHITEDGTEGRWHHHLVVNATGRDYAEIRELWSAWGDNVDFEPLLDGAVQGAAAPGQADLDAQPGPAPAGADQRAGGRGADRLPAARRRGAGPGPEGQRLGILRVYQILIAVPGAQEADRRPYSFRLGAVYILRNGSGEKGPEGLI